MFHTYFALMNVQRYHDTVVPRFVRVSAQELNSFTSLNQCNTFYLTPFTNQHSICHLGDTLLIHYCCVDSLMMTINAKINQINLFFSFFLK
jgi:hypothetical protein